MPNLRAYTFGNARRSRVVVERIQQAAPPIDLTGENWVLNWDAQTSQKRFAHAPASAEVCDRLIAVQSGEEWRSTVRASGTNGQRLTLRLADNVSGTIVSAIRPELTTDGSIDRSGEFTT